MKFKAAYLILILAIVFSCQKPSQSEIAEAIGSRIGGAEVDSTLLNAYKQNGFEPFWVKSGELKDSGEALYAQLEGIKYDGLNKADYLSEVHIELLEKIRDSKDPAVHAQLDIVISQAFLKLASDLNIGKVDPATIDIAWKMDRKAPTVNYQEVLLDIAAGKTLKESLERLRPHHSHYEVLRDLLKTYLTAQGKEKVVVPAFDGKIEKGDRHSSIPFIRQKLFLLKDLMEMPEGENEVYDERLYGAVKKFQKRHGLMDDGVIGADFVAAINYSRSDMITKIRVNMERLRWLPDFTSSGKNQVIVNIPDFHLYYIQEKDTLLTSKVVVGKDYRQTPVFKAEMTYLVFSPTWTLPETILWEDAIPSIKQDEDYLAENNMKVLDFQENEVNHKKIKWNRLQDKTDFPYLIRQAPGSSNPLGKVKFMFPNAYSIYIHDSPAKGLFSQDGRTFSSGCIRMDKPKEFAAILLEESGGWDEERISEAMNLEKEKKVNLEESQDVWILYLTVWSREEGIVEVREDVYGMDRKLAKALSLPLSDYFL